VHDIHAVLGTVLVLKNVKKHGLRSITPKKYQYLVIYWYCNLCR